MTVPKSFRVRAGNRVLGFVCAIPSAGFEYTEYPDLPVGARAYHASNSGVNTDDGLTEATAKADWWGNGNFPNFTNGILNGIREGYGDRILLRGGDTFSPIKDTGDDLLAIRSRSGGSADAPTIISSYGESDERPIIEDRAIILDGLYNTIDNQTVSHVWIIGIHLKNVDRPNTPALSAISIKPPGFNDILIEDCMLEGHRSGIGADAQGGSDADKFGINMRIRACVIVDMHSDDTHAQGAYLAGIHGALIENNWTDRIATLSIEQETIYQHGWYIQYTCKDVTVIDNFSSRCSANACQLRPSGLMSRNVFIENAFHGFNGNHAPAGATLYNLFVGGKNIGDHIQDGAWHDVFGNTDNSLAASDSLSDSASGDVDMHTRDHTPNDFKRWYLAGPNGGTGKAVATAATYIKSTSADPIFIAAEISLGGGGGKIGYYDDQQNCVPIDSDKGAGMFLHMKWDGAGVYDVTTCYRCELTHDAGTNHDTVEIIKSISGVETTLASEDLGLNYWTWGTDILSFSVLDNVFSVKNGGPTGTVIAQSVADTGRIYGAHGIYLFADGARVKDWQQHEVNTAYPLEVAHNIATGVDANYGDDNAGFKINGSMGGIDFHHNISWKHGIGLWFDNREANTSSASFADSVFVSDFNGPTGEDYLFYSNEPIDTETVSFARNTWYQPSVNYWWSVNANATGGPWTRTSNSATWIGLSGETDGVYLSDYPDYSDPDRGPVSYMASLGLTATMAAFYAKGRTLSKKVPGSGLTTRPVIDHVRAGFDLAPVPG